MLFRIPKFKIIILLLPMFVGACEPISIPEEPKEYDAPVDLVALIVPDTVRTGNVYAIQFSFGHQCGQTSISLAKTEGPTKISIRPLVHVNSLLGCSGANVFDTITDTIHSSIDSITLIGRNVTLTKIIHRDSLYSPSGNYSMRFRFASIRTFTVKPYAFTTLSFLDSIPVFSTDILADSTGTWDTTFVGTSLNLNYAVAGIPFQAMRGIRYIGSILVP